MLQSKDDLIVGIKGVLHERDEAYVHLLQVALCWGLYCTAACRAQSHSPFEIVLCLLVRWGLSLKLLRPGNHREQRVGESNI